MPVAISKSLAQDLFKDLCFGDSVGGEKRWASPILFVFLTVWEAVERGMQGSIYLAEECIKASSTDQG